MEYLTDNNLISRYLSDESGLVGNAEGICFPKNEDEVAQSLHIAKLAEKTLTIQGGRTGFRGQAVPQGGYVLNLSKMDRISFFRFDPATRKGKVTVEAGVTLAALEQLLREKDPLRSWDDPESQCCWQCYLEADATLFFPPNPTENSATIGGVLATGATGSHDRTPGGSRSMASDVRRIGSVITACTLELTVYPEHTCGLLVFSSDYLSLWNFLTGLIRRFHSGVLGAEFFDCACSHLAQLHSDDIAALKQIPHFPAGAKAGLCMELAAPCEEDLFSLLEEILSTMEKAGLDPNLTIATTTRKETQQLLSIRHTLTEAANFLSLGLPKPILEQSLPAVNRDAYPSLLHRASDELATSGLPGVLFGQALAGTLHLRLLPSRKEQLQDCAHILAHLECR